MFTNEQKLRLVQLFALIAQELKQVLEQVFKWNRIVSLVVVAEIVYLNAAKIENLTHAILLSEVFKQVLTSSTTRLRFKHQSPEIGSNVLHNSELNFYRISFARLTVPLSRRTL